MEQLTQQLKSGDMSIQELPWPQVGPGMVLVRNHYSLISAGTEGSTVKAARKSLIGKAKERPQQFRQVIDVLKKQGPVQTYRAVMKKLDAYSPMGYSSAGEVIEVGSGVSGFGLGDKVACAGVGYANHAEIVCVPTNLCVKLPSNADLSKACYNTLGAIALQGLRQADLRLGEGCAVIGLGLIGQLTCLMLQASSVKVVGIDIDNQAVTTAERHCVDLAIERSTPGIDGTIASFTNGLGVDAVIIAAGTSSLDPINFAGKIARKKGRIVVVGAVPTGFDRENYYRKELELRMSCSYGPGRYVREYEEKGIDYPPAYVRWTEKRNMQAFQELVHSGKIDISYLTTHTFSLEQAPRAYDMIVNKSEPYLGVVLEYDASKPVGRRPISVNPPRPAGKVGVAFIGAGSYAQGNLLPNLPDPREGVVRKGVMTNSGTTSKRVAERFRFEFCTSNETDILGNKEINVVFIATRHESHADYVVKALRSGKHVFVEKPLALNEGQLKRIRDTLADAYDKNERSPTLTVGFNRRFAPLTYLLRERLGSGPMSMIYRVNAGYIPSDHWYQDKEVGGGRIIGEVCHFMDYLTFLNGSLPQRVYASALPDPDQNEDTVCINLEFADGSVGTICYFANGSKRLCKEHVEVYCGGVAAVLRDFKSLEVYTDRATHKSKTICQDKGQKAMLRRFFDAVRNGEPMPIPFEEMEAVTRATFRAVESYKYSQPFSI
ncbi:MAG: bi-domain-containing oxidoreductase [Phycisphaerales bacterium]|nr:MAG: bi-domain-containing oxidoreductase [Phycisphaerales bacterium]